MSIISYMFFAYLGGAIVLIFLMLMRNRKIDKAIYLTSRFALISYPALIVVCIACLTYISLIPPPFTEEYRARQRRTWDTYREIGSALRSYLDENGQLPTSLRQLVPRYVQGIAPPEIGDTGWMYRKTNSKAGFALEIGYDSYCGLSYPVVYNLADGTWRRQQPAGDNK